MFTLFPSVMVEQAIVVKHKNVAENVQYVASSYASTYITGSGSSPVVWTQAVSCGAGSFVAVAVQESANFSSVTWSANNGATISSSSDGGSLSPLEIFNHIANLPAGTTTITVTAYSGGAYGSGYIQLACFTGLASNALNTVGSYNSGSGTTISCTVSADNANELIIAQDYTTSGVGQLGSGLQPGWVLKTVSGNSQYGYGYDVAGSSGTNTFTSTVSSSSWSAQCAAYK